MTCKLLRLCSDQFSTLALWLECQWRDSSQGRKWGLDWLPSDWPPNLQRVLSTRRCKHFRHCWIAQQDLAAKCNIEKSNFSRLEAGGTNPTLYTLIICYSYNKLLYPNNKALKAANNLFIHQWISIFIREYFLNQFRGVNIHYWCRYFNIFFKYCC